MKEILLKDIDDGEVLVILTVPEEVSLKDAKETVFELRDKWMRESSLTLIEFLEEHCPEGWDITLPPHDDREEIYI